MKKLIVLLIAITAAFTTFAQKEKNQMQKPKTDTAIQVKYTCPMHPEVVMDKPGKCPKCGMDLTRSKKEQMKMEVMKMYTCPMHTDVVSDKPDKCPKCGMTLQKRKVDTDSTKMKM